MFIDAEPGGLIGAVHTMMRLREECPWDREQTHQSSDEEPGRGVLRADRGGGSTLPEGEPDWVAYAAVEDELGDVLLQVLFHAVIARQAGAFDIDDVAEVMRQKLVRRHPHVFGDVEVGSAEEVKSELGPDQGGGAGLGGRVGARWRALGSARPAAGFEDPEPGGEGRIRLG